MIAIVPLFPSNPNGKKIGILNIPLPVSDRTLFQKEEIGRRDPLSTLSAFRGNPMHSLSSQCEIFTNKLYFLMWNFIEYIFNECAIEKQFRPVKG